MSGFEDGSRIERQDAPVTTPVLVTPLREGVAVPIRGGIGRVTSSDALPIFDGNPKNIARVEAERRVASQKVRTRKR